MYSSPELRLTSQFRNGSLILWKMSYTLEMQVPNLQSFDNSVSFLLFINIVCPEAVHPRGLAT